MKRILTIILAAAAVLTACQKEKYNEDPSGEGSMSLHLSNQTKANDNVEDFTIKITESDGSPVGNWDKYSEFPSVLSLNKGDYKIVACSPDTLVAAFDQPIYKGSKDFSITPSKLASVNLVCTMSNMGVQIVFTDHFKAELKDYEAVASISEEASGRLVFDADNIGAIGYFKVLPLTIRVSGKRVLDDSVIEQTILISDVHAQDMHKITLDAVETGSLGAILTIDGTTNDKETSITIPGEDEELPSEDLPTITGDGIGSTLTYTTTTASSAVIDVAVATPNSTIKNLIVSINSDVLSQSTLQAVGLDSEFDLANVEAGSERETALKSLNLLPSDGSSIQGKDSYSFSIGSFMGLLAAYGTSDSVFKITVTSAAGKTTVKELRVKIQ